MTEETRSAPKVVRTPHIAPSIIVVDGLPGCGKTMMSPIVSALDRVELMQYSYEIEYACSLAHLGKIDRDASVVLIRLFSDLQLYNVMMSRETNFRWTDLSSVRLNPKPLKYLVRLFQAGDAAVIDRVKRKAPILHLVTHMLFNVSHVLFDALGDRLTFIEVVRHPLYMIKQQYAYQHRYGTDVRDFNVWFEYKGKSLPWFAKGWEEKYIGANSMDQVIYMIEETWRTRRNSLALLSNESRTRFVTIPFERYVMDPEPYMSQIERVAGTRVTKVTRREMKRQKVPRKMYAEGVSLPIYREYGWEPPGAGTDEAREFEKRRRLAEEKATSEAMQVLDRLCSEYEQNFMRSNAPLDL